MSGSPDYLIIDDRASDSVRSFLGGDWRLVTDTVMGGVSHGELRPAIVQGRPCLRMTGQVHLENNGGFVQASLDLGAATPLDASRYRGVSIEVCGNNETYNLHLRTADTNIVWQSYRASFTVSPDWETLRLPFAVFQPHRIDTPLDVRRLKRLGLVAIGRAFAADLCFGRLGLYR